MTGGRWTAVQVALVVCEVAVGIALLPILLPLAIAYEIRQQRQRRTDMAKQPKPEPDVKVHHAKGCDLDGRTDQHTHRQQEWRELIDRSTPEWMKDGR